MNKDKFNLDSLTTEELQGMVKAGKMAEYILSHREVDRAELLMSQDAPDRYKEVLQDSTISVVKVPFPYKSVEQIAVMWREHNGDFRFRIIETFSGKISHLESYPLIGSMLRDFYDRELEQYGDRATHSYKPYMSEFAREIGIREA